tara:strand:- start:99 stop:572 length:474 start_codon:yes stop_codon:yes gene_type:complete
MWTGLGTLTLADTTEWFGAGKLLTISEVDETSEIAARGADITLSAIPSEVLSLALTEPYQGRECNIYFGTFDNGDQTTAPNNFNEIFSGYMDQMNISEDVNSTTVELKVENKLIDLERSRVARFTSNYQKSKFPTDTGLDFIESMQDKKINWGKPNA